MKFTDEVKGLLLSELTAFAPNVNWAQIIQLFETVLPIILAIFVKTPTPTPTP